MDKQALWVSLLTLRIILAGVYSLIWLVSNFHEERKHQSRDLFLDFLSVVPKDVEVGNLKVNTKYRVSVGAYGWAGEGRPSMPRDVSTASHGMWVETRSAARLCNFHHRLTIYSFDFPSVLSDKCMPPSPPTQPSAMAVSDTELALSWQQGESEGSAPVLHFLVAYIRSVPS